MKHSDRFCCKADTCFDPVDGAVCARGENVSLLPALAIAKTSPDEQPRYCRSFCARNHFSRRRAPWSPSAGQHPRHFFFPFIQAQQADYRHGSILPNLFFHEIVRMP